SRKNYDVNVFGLLAVTQTFLPLLRAAQGMVVNQSSISAVGARNQPFIGMYSSSKAAATAISNSIRVDFEPFNVKVITLMTSDVQMKFWQKASTASVGLPQSSLYDPIRDSVEAMMRGDSNPPGQHSHERWARKVADDLLRRNPAPYVRGGYLVMACEYIRALVVA
ncbi:hypothetical protein BGW36DRAFT_286756, partial [Talaromyces proteolyticus]